MKKQCKILLFAVASYLLVFMAIANTFEKITAQEIATAEAKAQFTLVDVRTPEEYQQGHIQGAINIPHTEIADNLDKLSSDKPIVVYCRSGRRAQTALEILSKQGFNDIRHLEGDMLGWQAENRPIAK